MVGLVSSLALATSAVAQHGGGHAGGPPGGMPPGAGAGLGGTISGQVRSGPGVDFGVTTRDAARVNSQGAAHASDTGRAHANANSAIASGTNASALAGLMTGETVRDSSGATLGTVSRIERSDDGTIRTVLVASADGKRHRTIRLAPSSLSLSGGVVVTTATPR